GVNQQRLYAHDARPTAYPPFLGAHFGKCCICHGPRSPPIEVRLKPNKGFAYFRGTAEFRCCVADGPVSQFEKMQQLRLVELANAIADVLRQDEIEKGLKLRVVVRGDEGPAGVGALPPCDWRKRERDVGEHVV